MKSKVVCKNMLVIFLGFCCVALTTGCDPMGHVSGNVPKESHFNNFLTRDLSAYFNTRLQRPVVVEFDMLRRHATQSGTSLPKYYIWVRISEKGKVVEQGAARIVAVEKTHFEILQYITQAEIQRNPEIVKSLFPESLCPDILMKAKAN